MTETAGESTPWDCDVLLPDEILRESPSAKDGVAAEVELAHRAWGAELVQEAAILLRLPQVVACTAQNLFHRFLYRKSLRRFDAFAVAMGALFLAAKIEERPKRLRDVLLVFYHAHRKRKGLPHKVLEVGGVRYQTWQDALVKTERHLLKELGFMFYSICDHPHKFILYYVRTLDADAALAQRAGAPTTAAGSTRAAPPPPRRSRARRSAGAARAARRAAAVGARRRAWWAGRRSRRARHGGRRRRAARPVPARAAAWLALALRHGREALGLLGRAPDEPAQGADARQAARPAAPAPDADARARRRRRAARPRARADGRRARRRARPARARRATAATTAAARWAAAATAAAADARRRGDGRRRRARRPAARRRRARQQAARRRRA